MAIATADFDDDATGVPTATFGSTAAGRRTVRQTLYRLLSQHYSRMSA